MRLKPTKNFIYKIANFQFTQLLNVLSSWYANYQFPIVYKANFYGKDQNPKDIFIFSHYPT